MQRKNFTLTEKIQPDSKRSSMWTLSFYGYKTGAIKHHKAVSF